MKKIVIIGCPGSGKTTLAIKLGKMFDIPVFHLDDYQNLSSDDFKAKQDEIMKDNKWIIDGNFTKTIDKRATMADTVIFLDFPRRLVYFRALKRYFRNFIKKRSDVGEPEASKWSLVKYIWTFPRQQITSIIEKYAHDKEVLIFQHPNKLSKFLKRVG